MKIDEYQKLWYPCNNAEKMAQPNFEGFSIFAFGYTHASNLADIPKKLNGAVSLLHQGAGVKGIWRIVPLPKPKSFSFSVHDNTKIRRLFELVDEFLLVSFLFASDKDGIFIEGALSDGCVDFHAFRSNLNNPHIFWCFDLDNQEFESGIAEYGYVSDDISSDVKAILMI